MAEKHRPLTIKGIQAMLAGLLAVMLYVTAVRLPGQLAAREAAAPAAQSGSLVVRAVDVNTLESVEGAEVVILDTQQRYLTGTDGKTAPITVPIKRDTRFDQEVPKPWGEVSLIVYKEGYVPYAVFYLQVTANQQRNGPTVYLIPPKDTANKEAVSIIEGPKDDWVREIVRKYAP